MIKKPTPPLAGEGADNGNDTGPRRYTRNHPPSKSNAIRADLIGADTCHADGLTTYAVAPVLAMCRRLLTAGYAGATPLEAWRGEACCLRIRSIGEAAALEINGAGTGFRPVHGPGTALPIRFNGNSPE